MDGLGAATAVFDGFRGLHQLSEGQSVEGVASLGSAVGAVLSAVGRRSGGYVSLGASALQLGHGVYENAVENAAYHEQTSAFFESQGFSAQAAASYARVYNTSAPVLSALGHGQGPGGTDLSANEVFRRARELEDYENALIRDVIHQYPADENGNLVSTGIGPGALAQRTLEQLRRRLFQDVQ